MTAEATDRAAAAPAAKPRPTIHLTAENGWINDPYGVTWVDDRYHLFYQAIPGRVTWAPNCHWGHAESIDLVHWVEQPLALVPQAFEIGCWSGSFVMDGDQPTILYTRIIGGDLGYGRVAIAYGDELATTWVSAEEDVVIDGPPTQIDVHSFRDPYVFRSDTGEWRAILAAGLADGSGAALQYHSADLRRWTYDGVICSRRSDSGDDVWTGSLWECPQLFAIGADWVLLISVWDNDILHYVAGAIGDYDGTTFTPRRWQRLTYGSSAYAMSAFIDKEGRRCVISWLREEPQNDPDLLLRAGAHSIVSTISVLDGSLVLRPHPDVDNLRGRPLEAQRLGNSASYDIGPGAVDLVLKHGDVATVLVQDGDAVRARLEIDPISLLCSRPGLAAERVPFDHPASDAEVRILLDADLLEVFGPGTYGAFRIPPAADPQHTTLVLEGAAPVSSRACILDNACSM
ncbi:MAG TPA: glycoside hydrolase family 32 protein [Acidothermaceae bacterium]|jgi:beta-fructofuranosidase